MLTFLPMGGSRKFRQRGVGGELTIFLVINVFHRGLYEPLYVPQSGSAHDNYTTFLWHKFEKYVEQIFSSFLLLLGMMFVIILLDRNIIYKAQ